MNVPRRRVIRAAREPIPDPLQAQRHAQKLRERLQSELNSLARWQPKLKRAFNTVQKCQRRIVRIERQLARLEG